MSELSDRLPGQLDVDEVLALVEPAGGDAELLDAPGGLLAEALAVTAEQAAVNTRRAYSTSYRALHAFATARLGGRPVELDDVDRDLVVAFRDELAARGAATATISVRLSAIRRLADALDLDPRIQRVKTTGSQAAQVLALTPLQYQQLLAAPDLRTAIGRRDRVVRDAKGGTSGTVPLSRPAWSDLAAWMPHRPVGPTTALFVGLTSNATEPRPLDPKAFERLMAKHARAAGLPDELATPHVLRHTFCTRLAEAGRDIDVIRDLARHRDIRTTQRYIHVTDQRRADAIAGTFTDSRSALR